jgi:AraC-like DNA-binding protein
MVVHIRNALAQGGAGNLHGVVYEIVGAGELVEFRCTNEDIVTFRDEAAAAKLAVIHLLTLRQRISQYIRERVSDADLTPRAIAENNGISLSYLHRIFNEHGTTVTSYVLDQRLNLAYEKLANPLGPQMTVAEVGYSVGFKSASHFSKSFAARYNMTPTDVRQR